MEGKATKILVDEKDLEKIYNDYTKFDKVIPITYCLVGIVASGWCSYLFSASGMPTALKAVFLTIAIILSLTTFGLIIWSIFLKLRKSLLHVIREKAQRESDWTAIFVVSFMKTTKEGQKIIEILVEYVPKWQCDFLLYEKLDGKKKLEEQLTELKKTLADKLKIGVEDLEIYPIENSECYNIKLYEPNQVEPRVIPLCIF